jgi:putative nucleotidyltransferase with HDIG domain
MFVDDEPNVLDAYRRTLHSMRKEWSMRFAQSGPEALAALAGSPADVVVADMRMPGMDGRALLAEVKQLYPQAVRFILSGHADRNSIMSVAGIAHQYLSKPCDTAVLKSAITRTQSLRKLLYDGDVARRIGGIEDLPSLPGVYQRLVVSLQQPESSLADIGHIISEDMAMTATILKFVNSAFFGMQQSIQTVARAVSFLGIDTISGLVLAHGVFKPSGKSTVSERNLQDLWQHSLRTAACARVLATHERWSAVRVEEAFLAALLHDVGRIVPGHAAAAPAAHLVQDVDHATIGAYLLGLWGFSDIIVEAVAFHHCPSSAAGTDFGLPGLIHVADFLVHQPRAGKPEPAARSLELALLNSDYVSQRLGAWQNAWQHANAGSQEAA